MRSGVIAQKIGMTRVYNDAGWPAQVEGDALTGPYSAPSAGPAATCNGSRRSYPSC